jgi:hypothetical protein
VCEHHRTRRATRPEEELPERLGTHIQAHRKDATLVSQHGALDLAIEALGTVVGDQQ